MSSSDERKAWRDFVEVLGGSGQQSKAAGNRRSSFGLRGLSPTVKKHRFEPGKKYVIGEERVKYLRKEGEHHVFVSVSGGWRTSWTDMQLAGEEVRNG